MTLQDNIDHTTPSVAFLRPLGGLDGQDSQASEPLDVAVREIQEFHTYHPVHHIQRAAGLQTRYHLLPQNCFERCHMQHTPLDHVGQPPGEASQWDRQMSTHDQHFLESFLEHMAQGGPEHPAAEILEGTYFVGF